MNNIYKLIKSRWKYLLVLFVFFFYIIWTMKPFDSNKGTTVVNTYGKFADANFIQITKSQKIKQDFIASSETLKKVSIFFVTYGRKNTSDLTITVKCVDTSKIIYNKTIASNKISDASYYPLLFDAQKDVKKKHYQIEISSPNAELENCVAVRAGTGVDKKVPVAQLNNNTLSSNISFNVEYKDDSLAIVKLLAWIVLLLLSVICILFVKKADEKSFLFISIVLGTLFVFYNPFPHPVDERTHFFRSYAISQGSILDSIDANGNIGAEISDNYSELIDNNKLTLKSYYENKDFWNQPFSKERTFNTNPYMSSVVPINHSVSAFGLFVANLFGLSAFLTILVSRLADFLIYTICCYFAIKNSTYYKSLFFTVSLLPLCIWLAASCTQDAILNGAVLLFMSICFKYYFDDTDKIITTRDCVIILLCGASIVSVKYLVYAPLLLFFFLIPKKKFKPRYFVIMIVLAFLIVLASIFSQIYLLEAFPFTEDRNGNVDVARQLSYIHNNMSTAFATFARYGVTHFIDNMRGFTCGFHSKTKLIGDIVSMASVSLIPLLEQNKHTYEHRKKNALLLLIASSCIVIVFLIILALYLGFTPVGKLQVDGIQTRYFIPILIPVFIFISTLNVENKIKKYEFFLPVFLCFGLIDLLMGMLMEIFR